MKVDIEVTCKYTVRKTFDVPENLVEKLDFGYVEEASDLSEFFADNLREEDAYELEYIIELFEPIEYLKRDKK